MGIAPVAFLGLPSDEAAITTAVVDRALELRGDQHDDLIRLLGGV